MACSQVDTAKARIAGGEAFEGVAREVSEANPESGGSQAWVHESELAGWMRSSVEALPAGGVSERIDADFGCGLVQVVEKRSFVPLTFDQAKERLHRRLFDERLAAEYKKLIDQLRAQTYIERKGIFGDTGITRTSGASSEPKAGEGTSKPGSSGRAASGASEGTSPEPGF